MNTEQTVPSVKVRGAEAATQRVKKKTREKGEEGRETETGFSVVSCLGAQCTARNKFSSCDHRTG